MEKETDDQRENLVGCGCCIFLTSCTAKEPLSSGLATSTITKQPILPTITPKITTTQNSQPTVEAEVISPLEEIVFGDCLEVQPVLPEDVYIPWDLIGSHKNKKVLFDVNQREYKFLDFFEEVGLDGLPIAQGYNIKISPDGKWIAYHGSYSKDNTLYLDSVRSLQNQSNENKIVLEIDRPFKLARWVDTDTLLINYIDEEAPYLYLTSFYDPFTGKEKIFSLRDYPNYLDTELGGAFIVSHYWNDGDLVPDPTMTRIIYPSLLNEPYDIKNNLWDTNEEKLVSKFDYMVSMDNQPFWALDGSDFLITTWQDKGEYNWFADWFWMSRDGDYRQITNFMEIMENNDYDLNDISRSPNGRYIAFLITFEDNGTVFSKIYHT